MRCIIVEDQAPAQRVLQKFIEDVDFLELRGTFTDALKAINFLNQEKIDLIFLDIHLPKMTGMEFLKIKPGNSQVILTTAYSEYALESYDYNVVDYLLKPIAFQRFVQAVTKANNLYNTSQNTAPQQIEEPETDEVFIKTGYDHVKISLSKIHYIKAVGDYSEIHLVTEMVLSSEPLKHWLNTLSPNNFIQVHKSYIVNISNVRKVSGNRILFENDEVPIGRVFKDSFSKRFLNR